MRSDDPCRSTTQDPTLWIKFCTVIMTNLIYTFSSLSKKNNKTNFWNKFFNFYIYERKKLFLKELMFWRIIYPKRVLKLKNHSTLYLHQNIVFICLNAGFVGIGIDK